MAIKINLQTFKISPNKNWKIINYGRKWLK